MKYIRRYSNFQLAMTFISGTEETPSLWLDWSFLESTRLSLAVGLVGLYLVAAAQIPLLLRATNINEVADHIQIFHIVHVSLRRKINKVKFKV